MARIVNLSRFRKSKSRDDARKLADANAARFGRTKLEKQAEKTTAEQARLRLDGLKLDD